MASRSPHLDVFDALQGLLPGHLIFTLARSQALRSCPRSAHQDVGHLTSLVFLLNFIIYI